MKKLFLLWALVVSGCDHTVLKPGRCDFDTDCNAGAICNELLYCVVPGSDAGPGDAGADSGSAEVGQVHDVKQPDAVAPECTNNSQCSDNGRPICDVGGKCRPCAAADCKGPLPFCSATGACAACLTSTDCPGTTPICSSGSCVACNAVAAPVDGCSKRSPNKAACSPSGPLAGQCVSCATDQQCGDPTKPICSPTESACRACTTDIECVAKSSATPGICMSHEDGRCATAAETVVVNGSDLQGAITAAVTSGKKLVVVTNDSERAVFSGPAKLSIVGKGIIKPTVAGGIKPGLSVTGGQIYLRNLLVTSSAGGILIDGASFEIENCEVSRNNTGTLGIAKWGGILINNPGMPKLLRNVTINENSSYGLVCSAPIVLTNVTSLRNNNMSASPDDNIAPECK